MPAGTSTEFLRNCTDSISSTEGELHDSLRRTGVRRSERIGAQHHRHADAQLDAQAADHIGEPAPRRIGFGPRQQQQIVAGRVAADLQLDLGPDEPGVDAVAQLHRRAPGAVVDEHVTVERGEWPRRARALDRGHRRRRRATCVDPARQHDDQHRCGQRGQRLVQTVRGLTRRHQMASNASTALAAAPSTCNLNGSSSAASRWPSAPPR